MNAHLSKELRGKLKSRKRSILLHSGDTVRVMRGPGKGMTTPGQSRGGAWVTDSAGTPTSTLRSERVEGIARALLAAGQPAVDQPSQDDHEE